MASRDENEETFNVLAKCGAKLEPRLVSLLQLMGYRCYKSLEKLNIDKVEVLETSIRQLLANERRLKQMSEIEKEELFGPLFQDDPAGFRFLPGEIDSIAAAVDVCKIIVHEKRFPFLPVHSLGSNTRQRIQMVKTSASNTSTAGPSISASNILAAGSNNFIEQQTELPNIERTLPSTQNMQVNLTHDDASRSLVDHVTNWFKKNGKDCNYMTQLDCTVKIMINDANETFGLLACNKCKKVEIKVFKQAGKWKISNFTRHLKVYSA